MVYGCEGHHVSLSEFETGPLTKCTPSERFVDILRIASGYDGVVQSPISGGRIVLPDYEVDAADREVQYRIFPLEL